MNDGEVNLLRLVEKLNQSMGPVAAATIIKHSPNKSSVVYRYLDFLTRDGYLTQSDGTVRSGGRPARTWETTVQGRNWLYQNPMSAVETIMTGHIIREGDHISLQPVEGREHVYRIWKHTL